MKENLNKTLADMKQFYENTLNSKEALIDKLKLEILNFTEQRFNKLDQRIWVHDDPDSWIRDLNQRWEILNREREKDIRLIKDHERRIEELRGINT